MEPPKDPCLPFFAYGLFKPGQLGFFRIRDSVKSVIRRSSTKGILKERDGIPILVDSQQSEIKGTLIFFKEGRGEGTYSQVGEIEPKELYRWGKRPVHADNDYDANVLLGRKEKRGSVDLEGEEEWDGRKDPLFKEALEEVEEMLRANSEFCRDLKRLFRLEMAYFLLWSAIERYTSLRYHLGEKATTKVYSIAQERAFADALKDSVRDGPRTVYSTGYLKKCTLDPGDPKKAIEYYYQVRSNAVHRGKAVARDFDTVRSSLRELLEIFTRVKDQAFADAEFG